MRTYTSKLISLTIVVLVAGCVEPFEFQIESTQQGIVIEGFITDVSYLQSDDYPAIPRYHYVKVTGTSDVRFGQPVAINDAQVFLESSNGTIWYYTEGREGLYYLYDQGFAAQRGIEYRLNVTVEGEVTVQSEWTCMPPENFTMGNFTSEESTELILTHVDPETNEKEYKEQNFVNVYTEMPNTNEDQAYYKWELIPEWLFQAPLVDVNPTCFIYNDSSLNKIVVEQASNGGYPNQIFRVAMNSNYKIYYRYSVLVKQYKVNRDYYSFWKEMQELSENNGLFSTPPYNLSTNFRSNNPDYQVYGYFDVVDEEARRWYYDPQKHPFENSFANGDYYERCFPPPAGAVQPPPPPECGSCLRYPQGRVYTSAPEWW